MTDELISELKELTRKEALVEASIGLLHWDQEVMMPPKGAPARAEQIEVLSGIHHGLVTDPRIGEILKELDGADLSVEDAALVRETKWYYERAVNVPKDLAKRMARHSAEAVEVWREARKKSDFSLFQPALEKMVELKKEFAKAVDPGRDPYEVLLHGFEPRADLEEVRSLLMDAKEKLAPLLKQVLAQDKPDMSLFKVEVDESTQHEFGLQLYRSLGYDLDAGRVDVSTHPFSTNVGDQRITTRFSHGWASALSAGIHEVGHALYEQGLPVGKYGYGPVAQSRSLAVHESQSRLWENHVGRSQEFWSHWYLHLKAAYDLDASFEEFYAALHFVEADLIRVEANELTYPLHVILRFEIEQELVSGKLAVKDAPARWNALTQELLGITPPDDAHGILQDVHWGSGLIGYFPTYLLGSMLSAQLFSAARKDIPDLDERLSRGKTDKLLSWLREKVHSKGCLLKTDDLIVEATGKPLSSDDYVAYLTEKFSAIYGL